MCGGFATWSAVEKKPRSARQQIAWSRIIDAKPFVIPPSSPVSDAHSAVFVRLSPARSTVRGKARTNDATRSSRMPCLRSDARKTVPQGAQPARVQVTNNGDAAALGLSEVFFTFFEAAGGAYYEGSAAERAAAAGGNPETFEA